MRHITRDHTTNSHARTYKFMNNGAKRKARKLYSNSINSIKHHPYTALSVISMGVGLLAGAMFFYKRNR